ATRSTYLGILSVSGSLWFSYPSRYFQIAVESFRTSSAQQSGPGVKLASRAPTSCSGNRNLQLRRRRQEYLLPDRMLSSCRSHLSMSALLCRLSSQKIESCWAAASD